VCEVLSPTTASVDMGAKLRAYHRCGVPHYWIVDPEHETLTVYRWETPGYVVALAAGRDETVRAEPFGAIDVRVALMFGAEDPE
jgi:Uma2 family endonuclease